MGAFCDETLHLLLEDASCGNAVDGLDCIVYK